MRGNSLLEIIIVIGIFGLILSSLISLSTSTESLGIGAELAANALGKAKYMLAISLSAIRNDFYADIASSSVEVNDIDNFTKEVKSIFRWLENGREANIELPEIITNPDEAFGKSDCRMVGDERWQSPTILSSSIDLGSGNQATGIFARGGIVYLTTNNSNPRDPAADKNDFFIIDARVPTAPQILSRTDTGPGLNGVVVVGPYAYLANTSINAQLQVLDVSDIYHPRLITNFKIPGNYSDATTIAQTLFYNRHTIYLGTAKSQIEEFHMIDVTDPVSPHEAGRFEINAGINNIYAVGNYVYLATPNNEELTILDASNPNNLKKVGGFDAPGGSGNGKSLSRDRDTIYLGRTVGKNELFALNVIGSSSISVRSSLQISDSVNGLAASPGRLFLITNSKFEVLDSSDPSSLKIISSIGFSAKPSGLSCSGNFLYLSLLSSSGLKIIVP